MRALLAVLAAAALVVVAALPTQAQQLGIPEVEGYFNSVRTLKARFIQTNPNGSIVQGTLYLRRPGRMRFEYDAPSQLKIVADGMQATMWDNATRDFGQWPIGWTAATFLVRDPLVLSRGPHGQRVQATHSLVEAAISQAKK